MKPLKVRVKGTNTSFREVTGFEIGNLLLRAELVEFEEEPTSNSNINWEKVRINAAIAALQGLLANSSCMLHPNEEDCLNRLAKNAVFFANSLVEQLKKK